MMAAIALLMVSGAILVGGILFIRHARKSMIEESAKEIEAIASAPPVNDAAIAAYQEIVQRLRAQEKELTRLKAVESARALASENMSEAVLSNLSSGVVLFNKMALVQQANPAAKAILGYASPFGLHARNIFERIAAVRGARDSSPQSLIAGVQECLQSGASLQRIEADYATPAGEVRVLGISMSPVRGAEGAVVGVSCLLSDLTEITRLAEQVRTRENLAALGEMSAGIAHEFKNSLATISGYAQMIRKNASGPEQEFGAKIASETEHLTRVVTDFLNFARPQGFNPERLRLRDLLNDAAQQAGASTDLTGVAADIEITGDETALKQAFSNLFRNAADAAREGEAVRVTVTASASDSALKLVVSDNGRGISAEDLPKVFLPFFTTKSTGTGLGLALVQRIVVEHGGTVSVESDATGTRFTLSFPAQKQAQGSRNSG